MSDEAMSYLQSFSDFLQKYESLQSYLTTTRLQKLTVVFGYCEALETYSRILLRLLYTFTQTSTAAVNNNTDFAKNYSQNELELTNSRFKTVTNDLSAITLVLSVVLNF